MLNEDLDSIKAYLELIAKNENIVFGSIELKYKMTFEKSRPVNFKPSILVEINERL